MCPNNSNLVALAGFEEQDVKIYDRREGGVVRTVYDIADFSTDIHTVRWSPDGNWLAVGSKDPNVKVFDYGTEKRIFSKQTRDLSKIPFLNNNHL